MIYHAQTMFTYLLVGCRNFSGWQMNNCCCDVNFSGQQTNNCYCDVNFSGQQMDNYCCDVNISKIELAKGHVVND